MLLTLVSACGNDSGDRPLIFAAASLANVLTETAELYEQQTGSSVEFSFGGSTALANQIARLGAPADGVVLAGQEPVELLIGAQLVKASGVETVATNSLVVATSGARHLDSLASLVDGKSRVAIADPALAPAGLYAKQALQSVGAWDSLQPQLIPLLDVRSALAALKTGSVDFAIVYATDVRAEPDLEVALVIDGSLHEPVIYPSAVIVDSPGAEAAERFLQFLQTPEAREAFARQGFSLP